MAEDKKVEPNMKELAEQAQRETPQRPNRATRRRKPLKFRYTIVDYINVPANILTKPSHKYKKIRKEHAENRNKRTAKRARKARKEALTKIS